VGWRFADPTAAAKDYYRRTRIFPIMHMVGVRRTIAERHPWLPAAVLKAFAQAKAVALAKLSDTSATKVTLPFVEEQLKAARALMGEDFWSYGVASNRHVIEAFLDSRRARSRSRNCFIPRPLKGIRFNVAHLIAVQQIKPSS
jgi:4,5-dihydroxyphthalate decarboxylase